MERAARHRNGDVDAARADSDHPETAARRRMRIAAEQRLARLAEALQVQLMADAVAGLRVDDAVTLGHRSEEVMVIRVLEANLDGVVVNVGYRQLVAHMADAH